MRRSNRNFNIPPPGKPRAFDYFLCPGVGNLTDKAFPGVGNLTLPGGVGKIEPEVSGFKSLLFSGGGGGAPKSLTAINTCLDEMEELKEEIQHYKKKAYKKRSSKVRVLKVNINYFYRLYINDVDFLYNESSCGFVPQ